MRRGQSDGHDQAGESGRDPQQPGAPQREARLLAVDHAEGTVTVRLDDGREFAVAPGGVPPALPAVGDLVPVAMLAELQAAAARKLAARDLLALLGRKLSPMARLRRSLLERGHPPEAVDGVLAEMEAKGLCSDRLYAEAYCRDCLLTRAVGPRYLVAKLQEKQVPRAVAQAAAAGVLTAEDEADLARRAARGRWARISGQPDPKAVAKVMRFLLGRGFSPGVAAAASRSERPGSAAADRRTEE